MKKYVLIEKEDIKEATKLIKKIETVGLDNMFIDYNDGHLEFEKKETNVSLKLSKEDDKRYFVLANSNKRIIACRVFYENVDNHTVTCLKNINGKDIIIDDLPGYFVTQLVICLKENKLVNNLDKYKEIVSGKHVINVKDYPKFIFGNSKAIPTNTNNGTKLLTDQEKFIVLTTYCYNNIRPYYKNLEKYGYGVEYYDKLMEYTLKSWYNDNIKATSNYVLVVAVAFNNITRNTKNKYRKTLIKDDVFINSILTKGEIDTAINSLDGESVYLRDGLMILNRIDIDYALYNTVAFYYDKYRKLKVIEKTKQWVERMNYLNCEKEDRLECNEEIFKSTYNRNKDNFPFEKIEIIYDQISRERKKPINCLTCRDCTLGYSKGSNTIDYRCAKANNRKLIGFISTEVDMKKLANKDKPKWCPLLIKKETTESETVSNEEI